MFISEFYCSVNFTCIYLLTNCKLTKYSHLELLVCFEREISHHLEFFYILLLCSFFRTHQKKEIDIDWTNACSI